MKRVTEYYGTWANEKTCPICGKEFPVSTEEWAYKERYKNKFRYFCSWKCFRKNEQMAAEKKANRKPVPHKSAVGKADDIKSRLISGMRATDICRELNVCNASVNYWKKRLQAAGTI